MTKPAPLLTADPRLPAFIVDHALTLAHRMRRQVGGDADWSAHLRLGRAQDFPMDRDFAYCSAGPATGRIEIVLAPRIVAEAATARGRDRISGLLRHEFAHGLLLLAGLDHSERDADRVAADVFGLPVWYDADDVQTVNPKAPGARRPRPAYLPA